MLANIICSRMGHTSLKKSLCLGDGLLEFKVQELFFVTKFLVNNLFKAALILKNYYLLYCYFKSCLAFHFVSLQVLVLVNVFKLLFCVKYS